MKVLVILFLPTIVWGMTLEDHVLLHHDEIVARAESHGFPPWMASEISKYAQLRCLLEDGLDRKPTYSCNGMVGGGYNQMIIRQVDLSSCKLSIVGANDGQTSYAIEGPNANAVSAVAIALWFNGWLRGDPVWERSLTSAYIGDWEEFWSLKIVRRKLLERVNRMYGPGGDGINEKVRRVFQ